MNASSTIRNLALVLTTVAVLGFASAAEAHKGGSGGELHRAAVFLPFSCSSFCRLVL